jgi:hypothetical protein
MLLRRRPREIIRRCKDAGASQTPASAASLPSSPEDFANQAAQSLPLSGLFFFRYEPCAWLFVSSANPGDYTKPMKRPAATTPAHKRMELQPMIFAKSGMDGRPSQAGSLLETSV